MSMEVRKESNGLKNSMVTREELAIINRFTKRALKEDEVYTFAVRLCDNEMDRDGERFPRTTLEELAELFVGKSGIFDHEWTARGQAARIYRTEIVEEAGVEDIFDRPLHPYTRGLLRSIPSVEGDKRERLFVIEGVVPMLSAIPTGCRFGPRCPYATERCRREAPELTGDGSGHRVRCWNYARPEEESHG